MTLQFIPRIVGLISTLLIVLGSSCSGERVPQSPNMVETSPEPPFTVGSPSSTPALRPSITTTMTFTPLPSTTSTQQPSLTPRPTKTPTVTPLPTLSPQEAQALVADLLQNNGGCQLPCWWGIVPGETSWEIARQFLATFASSIRGYADTYTVLFTNIPETDLGIANQQDYLVEDGRVQIIRMGAPSKDFFSIPTVLSRFGKPSEIWIYAATSSPNNTQPIYMVLFYSEQGIMVRYFENPQRPGDPLQGCFHLSEDLPIIWLWSPEEAETFMDFAKRAPGFGLDFEESFRPISEVTDLTVETFYDNFKDSNNTTCLETPAENWD